MRVVPKHRLVQQAHLEGEAIRVDDVAISLEEGLGFVAQIDRYTAAIFPRLNGSRPAREAVAAAERALEIPPPDHEAFTAGARTILERMYGAGFLE